MRLCTCSSSSIHSHELVECKLLERCIDLKMCNNETAAMGLKTRRLRNRNVDAAELI
jgi:hypothetical protein